MFDAKKIDDLLKALGDLLEENNIPLTELVVIGGAALNCLGLINRPTKDIDCLAYVKHSEANELKLEPMTEFPLELKDAIDTITKHYGLPPNWINFGPTNLIDFGLPDGIEERLEVKEYGSRLKIYFAGRFDQIHFKLFAAETGPGRHVDDLLALKPSSEELLKASIWCMKQDPSPGFRQVLKDMLSELGIEDVSDRI